MTELVDLLRTDLSWRSLFLALLLFGFVPGFCLRVIVLAYPSGDPRRAELIAELYTVPRVKRPVWVAEQMEVALFEGLGHRISAAARHPRRRVLRRRAPMVATLALLVFGGSTVGLMARVAQPGDAMWSVTKMLYSNYARSVEAAQIVNTELRAADTTLKEGKPLEAKESLARAQQQLAVIAEQEGRTELVTRRHDLEEKLQETSPQAIHGRADPFTTPTLAPQPLLTSPPR